MSGIRLSVKPFGRDESNYVLHYRYLAFILMQFKTEVTKISHVCCVTSYNKKVDSYSERYIIHKVTRYIYMTSYS